MPSRVDEHFAAVHLVPPVVLRRRVVVRKCVVIVVPPLTIGNESREQVVAGGDLLVWPLSKCVGHTVHTPRCVNLKYPSESPQNQETVQE
jgi:hypothetical protein